MGNIYRELTTGRGAGYSFAMRWSIAVFRDALPSEKWPKRPTSGKPLSCTLSVMKFLTSISIPASLNANLPKKCLESAEEGSQRVGHYRDCFTDVRIEMEGVGVVVHKCAETDKRIQLKFYTLSQSSYWSFYCERYPVLLFRIIGAG